MKDLPSAPPPPITVLIVDDIASTRENIRRLLAHPRIQVIGEASDGNRALESFTALQPDVVVMNICMPGPDGIEVTRRMRAIQPEAKIIILTVQNEVRFMRAAILAGASDYQNKPPFRDELLSSVLRLGSTEKSQEFQGSKGSNGSTISDPSDP